MTPTVDPYDRRQVPLASSYHRGDPVWVHQHDQGWHPGVVQGASELVVVVRYQPAGGRGGQMVDTVMPVLVMPRDVAEPGLDETGQS